jgi:hypothetical protein
MGGLILGKNGTIGKLIFADELLLLGILLG